MRTSLNWLVRQYPLMFYPQEWYRSEPFAQTVYNVDGSAEGINHSAAAWAYRFVFDRIVRDRLQRVYVWTSDKDSEGNRVYIGRAAQYGGLQIHRLLTPEIEEP